MLGSVLEAFTKDDLAKLKELHEDHKKYSLLVQKTADNFITRVKLGDSQKVLDTITRLIEETEEKIRHKKEKFLILENTFNEAYDEAIGEFYRHLSCTIQERTGEKENKDLTVIDKVQQQVIKSVSKDEMWSILVQSLINEHELEKLLINKEDMIELLVKIKDTFIESPQVQPFLVDRGSVSFVELNFEIFSAIQSIFSYVERKIDVENTMYQKRIEQFHNKVQTWEEVQQQKRLQQEGRAEEKTKMLEFRKKSLLEQKRKKQNTIDNRLQQKRGMLLKKSEKDDSINLEMLDKSLVNESDKELQIIDDEYNTKFDMLDERQPDILDMLTASMFMQQPPIEKEVLFSLKEQKCSDFLQYITGLKTHYEGKDKKKRTP